MTNNNAIFGHLKIHLKFMYVIRHWPFWKLKTSIESKIELNEFELFRPFLSSQSCWKFNRSLLEVLLPIVIVIIESFFLHFSLIGIKYFCLNCIFEWHSGDGLYAPSQWRYFQNSLSERFFRIKNAVERKSKIILTINFHMNYVQHTWCACDVNLCTRFI